eukprot:364266-Chlamydomonas_euryale.AAC.4
MAGLPASRTMYPSQESRRHAQQQALPGQRQGTEGNRAGYERGKCRQQHALPEQGRRDHVGKNRALCEQ